MTVLRKHFTATLRKSPDKGDVRKVIGKEAGDTVTIRLHERLDA